MFFAAARLPPALTYLHTPEIHMNEPTTLDARLAQLNPEIDPELRDELIALGRTLRAAENPHGVILHTSRLALRTFQFVYRDAGKKWPSDNLFDVIMTAGPFRDTERKVPGHNLLPAPLDSAAHTLRTFSNKADHAAELFRLGGEAAELAVNALLTIVKWYYCEYPLCPTPLASLYQSSDLVSTATHRSRSSIPHFDTPFFGRRQELELVAAHLRIRPPARPKGVVTITGTGGIGKTRFACEAARELIDEYPGGCHLIELKDLETATEIAAAVAESLGYRLRDGNQDAAFLLGQILRDRPPTLLVLDNFEHLVTFARHTVRVWRGVAPQVRVLATSRHPLGVDGETVVPLTPLSVSPALPTGTEDVAGVFDTDAVRLLVSVANERGVTLEPTLPTARLAAELCRLLEGQPLAIKLVARRLDEFELSALVKELEADRLDMAQSDGHALWDTIRWSYDLLKPHEQEGFRRLSVFREGFTREAAVHLLRGVPCPDGVTPAGVLQRLREYCLVEMTHRVGRVRYKMFQTVQDFARKQWDPPTVLPPEIGQSWVEYFHDLTRELAARIGTRDSRPSLDVLSEERENVLAAIDWAGHNGWAERAARLSLSYADVLALRGPWQVRIELFRRTVGQLGTDVPELKADLLRELAAAVWATGDYIEAFRIAELALVESRRSGLPEVIARVLLEAGWCGRHAGAIERARALFDEGVKFATSAGLRKLAADHLGNLAFLHDRAGEYPKAIELIGRALEEVAGVEDIRLRARLVNIQGLIRWHAGEPRVALDCFERAYELFAEGDDPRWQAGAMTNRGFALIDAERLSEALAQFDAAGPLHLAQGNGSWWSVNQAGRGHALLLSGRYSEAAETLNAAYQRALETGYGENVAMIEGLLGRIASAEDADRAVKHFDRAIAYEQSVKARDRRHAGNLLQRAAVRLALGHTWSSPRKVDSV